MRIGVLGINHKLADLKLRECLARICHHRFSAPKHTHLHHTLVLLTTCNRSEVYFFSLDLAGTHSYIINILRRDLNDLEESFGQKLYSYFGHDCFKHLARVTAGLDSAIVAETEIQGQVKAAYEKAMEQQELPREMHFLFQKSLKIGKQIRTELPLTRGMPDLEHAIITTSYQVLKQPEQAKVLFVGASNINCKILAFLKNRQFRHITICNRTHEHAVFAAKKYQVEVLDWSKLESWPQFDMILFGTKSPEFVITQDYLPPRLHNPKLIIDLSVPRNVDPRLGKFPNISLLNIDQINRILKTRRKHMLDHLYRAEDIVHQLTKTQISLFSIKEKKREHFLSAC